MTTESKPPMRQIAELIDSIAASRAESAERLLGECETALIEAQAGEKAALETIADRDAEIAKLKDEIEGLRSQHNFDGFEIAKLRAELAEVRKRLAPIRLDPPNADDGADVVGRAPCDLPIGSVVSFQVSPGSRAPAADPRVDALCNLVGEMFRAIRHAHSIRHDPADLETIAGRR